jgi:tetratricopeptide (TPR) repeat protein
MRGHDQLTSSATQRNWRRPVVLVVCSVALTGCDRMIMPRTAQLVKDAEAKAADGEYLRAINSYETALDGSTKSADIHYRLALLYDDKVHDQLHALHHFKRYLTLAPSGSHATEVKNFMKRDELALVTSLSGDAIVPRAEAARLTNENLALRKALDDERGRAKTGAAGADRAKDSKEKKASAASKPGQGGRTYVIRRGDTLVSISRKFYKSSAHWKRILDANRKTVDDPENLKVGETLTIP